MHVTINGRPRELAEAVSVGALVDAEVPARRGVAVAVDGAVVRRRDWDETLVTEGAAIEIVGAVQGG